uniref:Uncharacterized protein n=1 Tax=Timema douglasi TaxID=61478 RepID=A0A7R8Z584_TIMDO|nr:unnamed protein product [Timema douglasi]
MKGEVHIICSVDCAESLANPVDLLTLLFSNIPVLGILPRDASGPGSKGTSPCMWLDPACPDDVIQALLADSSGSCASVGHLNQSVRKRRKLSFKLYIYRVSSDLENLENGIGNSFQGASAQVKRTQHGLGTMHETLEGIDYIEEYGMKEDIDDPNRDTNTGGEQYGTTH